MVPIDLATPDAARRVVSELAARRIRADALMNCAGFNRFGPFVEGDERRIMELLQVNMAALPHLTRLVLPGMVERGWGRRS